MKLHLSAAAALTMIASTAIATPAFADEGTGTSMHVKYDDLNLATPRGQARLEQRIRRAAKKVCEFDEQHTGTKGRPVEVRECYSLALASANRELALLIADNRLGG